MEEILITDRSSDKPKILQVSFNQKAGFWIWLCDWSDSHKFMEEIWYW